MRPMLLQVDVTCVASARSKLEICARLRAYSFVHLSCNVVAVSGRRARANTLHSAAVTAEQPELRSQLARMPS